MLPHISHSSSICSLHSEREAQKAPHSCLITTGRNTRRSRWKNSFLVSWKPNVYCDEESSSKLSGYQNKNLSATLVQSQLHCCTELQSWAFFLEALRKGCFFRLSLCGRRTQPFGYKRHPRKLMNNRGGNMKICCFLLYLPLLLIGFPG